MKAREAEVSSLVGDLELHPEVAVQLKLGDREAEGEAGGGVGHQQGQAGGGASLVGEVTVQHQLGPIRHFVGLQVQGLA